MSESLSELKRKAAILKNKIENDKRELSKIESEISNKVSKVLMFMIIKGKPTFVLHPKNQMYNLINVGWKVYSIDEMVEFLSAYDLSKS